MRWFWRTLWACASTMRSYAPLARAPWRDVRRYLLYLLLIIALPLSLAIGRMFHERMATLLLWAQELPTVTIVQGTAQFSSDEPVQLDRLDVAGIGHVRIGFDPTGDAGLLDRHIDFGAVLEPQTLQIRQRNTQRSYSLAKVQQLTVDDAFLAQWAQRITWWFSALLPLMIFLYSGIAKLFHAAMWSALTFCMTELLGPKITYPTLFRLAIFSLGPPTIFATIVETVAIERAQPVLWFVYLTIYAVLFGSALRATIAARATT